MGAPPNCLAPNGKHDGAASISFCVECYNASPASYTPTLAEACEVIRGLLAVAATDDWSRWKHSPDVAGAREFLKRVEGGK